MRSVIPQAHKIHLYNPAKYLIIPYMIKSLYAKEWVFFKNHLVIKFGWLIQLSALFTGLFYFAFLENPDTMKEVMGSIVQKLKDEGIFGLRDEFSFLLVLKIFYLNLRSTALFTALGLAPFLLGSALFLIVLPVLLGVSLAVTVTQGFDFMTFFKLTAPHGAFELCAVFYGMSLGVYLSKEITKKLFFRPLTPPVPLSVMSRQIVQSYILVVVPLLAIAAVIEVYVTPLLK